MWVPVLGETGVLNCDDKAPEGAVLRGDVSYRGTSLIVRTSFQSQTLARDPVPRLKAWSCLARGLELELIKLCHPTPAAA